MLVVLFTLLLALAVAGLVVVYVAYPHRGAAIPAAPWLGDAMTRAVGRAPLLEPDYEDAEPRR